MRVLADYVMRGRAQAVLAAVFTIGTVIFSWVGAAIVALVTLRRGSSEGSQVLLWALIPALVLAAWGDTGPVTTLLGVTLAAIVLRNTTSWSLALVAAVASGLLTGLMLLTLGQGYLEEVLGLFTSVIEQINSQADGQEQATIALPTAAMIAGLLGLSNAASVVMCLMLARWWQAMLYNPGGFRDEFHQLRLSPLLVMLLIVVGMGLTALGADYHAWALIVALPLLFAGLALVHGVAARRQLGGGFMAAFYIALLMLHPLKLLLLLLAVVDSLINIRGYIKPRDH